MAGDRDDVEISFSGARTDKLIANVWGRCKRRRRRREAALCGCHGVVYTVWHGTSVKNDRVATKACTVISSFPCRSSMIDLDRSKANVGQIVWRLLIHQRSSMDRFPSWTKGEGREGERREEEGGNKILLVSQALRSLFCSASPFCSSVVIRDRYDVDLHSRCALGVSRGFQRFTLIHN